MVRAPVIPFPQKWQGQTIPSGADLAKQVKALAMADSANIRMDMPHFQERMVERDVDMRSVLEVLRKGRPFGSPELDQNGDWRIKMRRKVAGRRVVVVVAVYDDHIDCITTWTSAS